MGTSPSYFAWKVINFYSSFYLINSRKKRIVQVIHFLNTHFISLVFDKVSTIVLCSFLYDFRQSHFLCFIFRMQNLSNQRWIIVFNTKFPIYATFIYAIVLFKNVLLKKCFFQRFYLAENHLYRIFSHCRSREFRRLFFHWATVSTKIFRIFLTNRSTPLFSWQLTPIM